MYSIAVISENNDRGNIIAKIVEEYIALKKLKISVLRFFSRFDSGSVEFERLIKSNMCIIDFNESKKTVKLIADLYEKRNDLVWICVGSDARLLNKLLLLRPSGYVQDITNADELCCNLIRILRFQQYNNQNKYFYFKYDGSYLKINYESISYFESSAKKVTLHLYNSEKKYYLTAKLNDIQSVSPKYFLRCHQSYLVNMNCIRCFDTRNKVIIALPNEEVLVSRRMYVASRQLYENFTQEQRDINGFIANIPL